MSSGLDKIDDVVSGVEIVHVDEDYTAGLLSFMGKLGFLETIVVADVRTGELLYAGHLRILDGYGN